MKIVLDEDPMNCMEAVTVGASTMTMEGAAYLIRLGAQAQREQTHHGERTVTFHDIDPLQVLRQAAEKGE